MSLIPALEKMSEETICTILNSGFQTKIDMDWVKQILKVSLDKSLYHVQKLLFCDISDEKLSEESLVSMVRSIITKEKQSDVVMTQILYNFICGDKSSGVEMLLKETKFDFRLDFGRALMRAIDRKSYKIVQILLKDDRINFDSIDLKDNIRTIAKNSDIEMLKILLKDGRTDPGTIMKTCVQFDKSDIGMYRLLLADPRILNESVRNIGWVHDPEITKLLRNHNAEISKSIFKSTSEPMWAKRAELLRLLDTYELDFSKICCTKDVQTGKEQFHFIIEFESADTPHSPNIKADSVTNDDSAVTDEITPTNANIGTTSEQISHSDLPYLSSGQIPDIIINPDAIDRQINSTDKVAPMSANMGLIGPPSGQDIDLIINLDATDIIGDLDTPKSPNTVVINV